MLALDSTPVALLRRIPRNKGLIELGSTGVNVGIHLECAPTGGH